MATRREEYQLDFSLDPVYEYQDPQGHRASRFFRPSFRPATYARKPPLYAAGAAPTATSTPLLLACTATAVVVLGVIIGIPLAVIFGVILPNSNATPEGTTQPPFIPPVDPPVVVQPTFPPPRRTLLMRCPDDILQDTDAGQNSALVSWDPPTILSQTTGEVQMTSSSQPPTRFGIGARSIEYTVTDSANNAGACSFQVTVIDNEPPSIQCPPDMTVPTDPLSISARIFWLAPTISDNSGIVARQQFTDEPGDQFHVGPHVVTIVIHDGANNENRCSFNILVEDREPPRLTCPATIRGYTNQPLNGTALVSWPDLEVRDNSLRELTVVCAPQSNSTFQIGTTQVYCSTTDPSGNKDNCTFDVIVQFNDTEPPMFFNCPSDIALNTTLDSDSAFATWVEPTATDNSLEEPTVTVNTEPNRSYVIGTYQVEYRAIDARGNVGQCTFSLQIQDFQNPRITCPANFAQNTDAGQTHATVTLPSATTSDNSMTSLTVTTNPPGPTLNIGVHTVTYTVEDGSGNSASCDIVVTIEDMEPPTFTPLSDFDAPVEEGQLLANVTLPSLSNLRDNSGEAVTVIVSPSSNSLLPIGMHDFTYNVSDLYGNSVIFTITVTVRDTEPPGFTPPSDFVVPTDDGQSTATVILPLPSDVTDNSGDIVTIATSPANSSMLGIGPHVITYTLTDTYSNSAMFNITVTVEDREDPVIMCPANFSQNTVAGQPHATVTLPTATTSDNSMTSLTVTTNPPGSPVLNIGVNTVMYTVEDFSGNSASCNITVTIEDNEPPSFTPPADFVVPTDDGQSTATVILPLPSDVNDNSGGLVTIATSPANSSMLGIGPHVITYTLTDINDNNVTFTITITVEDDEAPTFNPPSDFMVQTDDGQSTAIVILPLPSDVTDNSGQIVTIVTSPANSSMLGIGPHVINYTLTDVDGNNVTFTITVTVEDGEDPMITCPAPITQNNDGGENRATVTLPDPSSLTVSDNSGGSLIVTATMMGAVMFDIGTHTVTYTVTDPGSRTASCNLTITVTDAEDPMITCPAAITQNNDGGENRAIVILPDPSSLTVSDNSGGSLIVTATMMRAVMFDIGTHTVTYTVTDPGSRTASCNLTITVTDNEPPSFTPLSDFVVPTDDGQSTAIVILPLPSNVNDNSGQIVTIVTSPANSSMLGIGPHVINYTLTDIYGNVETFTITVTVEDDEAPTFNPPSDFMVQTDDGQSTAIVILPLPSDVTDNSGQIVTIVTSPANSSMLGIGPHVINYTLTDVDGNDVTFTITVTVADAEDPMITCPAPITQNNDGGENRAIVILPDPSSLTVSDNSGGSLIVTATMMRAVMFDIGTHTVTYTVTDPGSRTASCNLTITVTDAEDPMITCPANITQDNDGVANHATVILPNPSLLTVSDNSDGLPGSSLTITATMNGTVTFDIGANSVTYTVTDPSGRTASCDLTITVTDAEDPMITCPAAITEDNDGGTNQAAVIVPDPSSLTVSDNSGGDLTVTATMMGAVMFDIGTHTVTYTVTDPSGRTASCNLTITVTDGEDPMITCPADITPNNDGGENHATVTLPDPSSLTVSDNSGGDLTVTATMMGTVMFDIGTHTVTYTVTDPGSRTASCNLTITVTDAEDPMITCPANITQDNDGGANHATVTLPDPSSLTVSDNSGGGLTVTATMMGTVTFDIGTHTVTYTVTDQSGRTASCNLTITVTDNEPPTLQCPPEVIVYSNEPRFPQADQGSFLFAETAVWTVTTTDNSGLSQTVDESIPASGSLFSVPSTIVTHTATDAFGNSDQCSFEVRIIGFENRTCDPSGKELDLSVLAGTGVQYHLLSENFDMSGNYESDKDCVWRVSAPSGSFIRINFAAFETEYNADVLTIGSGRDETQLNTSLARYGGKLAELVANNTRHTKDRVFGDTIWLRFQTNPTFIQPFSGFWLRFDYITDPRALYPSSYSFCAEFGGFPCLDGSCVDISKQCDGNNNDCPSNEDETDCPEAGLGALPTEFPAFPVQEGVHHTDIVSDNYPGEYPLRNGRWEIDTNDVQSLRFVVMDLQISANDELYIIDRTNGSRLTENIVSPVSIYIDNQDVAVIFESNGGTGRGFWIRVWRYITVTTDFIDFPAYCEVALHSLHCGVGSCISDRDRCDKDSNCNRYINDEENCDAASYSCGNTTISLGNHGSTYHLTSVNYPLDFTYDINCQYVVTTTAARILVSFRDVEIPATTPDDYLRIGDGATISDATEVIRVGGVFLPEDVVSTGNQIWIEFFSNDNTNSRGFWIILVAQD